MQEGFEGYFKKANDFAFLKTQAPEESFLCVLTRKFGGGGIPAPTTNRDLLKEVSVCCYFEN
ncbi:MAG: hypothetical protein WCF93_00875, partial [Candidatus Moraniibacteriota bacterium]